MPDELYERGMTTRREVLGDEHVDAAIEGTTELTADFQDLITRYAWELPMHVRAAFRNGVTLDELKEVLLQCAIYCGVPAANGAFAIAQRVIEEESDRR
jgi:alkylhydroperoxidase/carboxymuconolactone decarboxylase family protein YurZ